MPSVLTLYNAHMKKIGQCDAKCYDGTGCQCRCICAGRNHGVGLRQAARNALAMNLRDCTPETVAPGAKNLTLKKPRHLGDFTHPTFWDP